MKTFEIEEKRKQVNIAACNYLCEQESGDFYDAYIKLTELSLQGKGDEIADYHVDVWEAIDSISVDELLELIDANLETYEKEDSNVPEFIKKIDWNLLREQKNYLLDVCEENGYDFSGLINLIDSIQDYAVDDAKIASAEDVFDSGE